MGNNQWPACRASPEGPRSPRPLAGVAPLAQAHAWAARCAYARNLGHPGAGAIHMSTDPKPWLPALAVSVVACLAGLGVWQLYRAQVKLDLQAAQQAAQALGPIPSLVGAAEHVHANLSGRWQPSHQLWLANRTLDGRSGFVLVTPLELPDGRWLWVQRGWHPRTRGAFQAPPWPPTPSGEVVVKGRLARDASRAFALGAEAANGAVRQNLDLAVAPRAGVVVADWVLWQLGGCAPLRCEWPAPDAGVAKHYGYAAQWFALSALTLGFYVWLRVRPRWRKD